MRALVTFLAMALAFSTERAGAAAAMPDLERTQLFAIGAIYEDGRMSEGERALRAILREPDATRQLEAMLLRAPPAGRLYALWGLRLRDRAVYTRVLRMLSKQDARVTVMRDGITRAASFQAVVSEIHHGKYDSPALTHPAW